MSKLVGDKVEKHYLAKETSAKVLGLDFPGIFHQHDLAKRQLSTCQETGC